jgi:hypothetical protein
MLFGSVAEKVAAPPKIEVRSLAGAALVLVALSVGGKPIIHAQPQSAVPAKVRLPDETSGIDGFAGALVSTFDQTDILALGEAHGRKLDSDLRIAVVRHPDFAKRVRTIVVEFGSTSGQSTLDRYIRGENISADQLAQVWKTAGQAANGDASIYTTFFAAVREVNSMLPADARIRVFGGAPEAGTIRGREAAAVSILKQEVLSKHGKALVVYGAAHFFRTAPSDYLSTMGDDIGIAKTLETDYPGRIFVVIPVGGRIDLPPGITVAGIDPDYQKFERALKTQMRPVLMPLQRLPFRDFTAEEFLGGTLLTCSGPGGCKSVFRGTTITLGQIADACIYVGGNSDVDTKVKSAR